MNYSGVIIDMGDVLVGASSWADRSLIASGWYPREHNTTAGRLEYYADRFPIVGVDTTAYAIPAVETVAAWVDRTPAGFTFDVTAFTLLTGHRVRPDAIPADLRPDTTDRVRHRDLDKATMAELWRRFHDSLAPLVDAGRLGAVLLRFPEWLARGAAARDRVLATARECRPHRVAVELRHPSWYEGPHALDTLRLLQAEDIAYVCVDESFEPGPVVVATAEPGVVRLQRAHTDAGLARWAQQIETLAREVATLHVLVDSPGGRAPLDAAKITDLLGAGRVVAQRRHLSVVRPT
jgi:uncharacterized protein YecE (DUF72 family)